MKTGLDRLFTEPEWGKRLAGRRVMLLTHPAAVTGPAAPFPPLTHSATALAAWLPTVGAQLTALFGPQHGVRGDKQDNMVFSADEVDPLLGIPVFSLYGERLKPSARELSYGDLLLVDLQDVGCRVYTFLTTLRYVLEAAAEVGLEVWVLDRPNPIGRAVEGLCTEPGWESFVAAGACALRHGLTLGEAARWFAATLRLDLALTVVWLKGWQPEAAPAYGWPLDTHVWIPPSPNAPTPWMARCYPGTVMVEGTTLSEGRGTTRPLECFGAPWLDPDRLLAEMARLAPHWLTGCALRPIWFEPTFHKHAGKRCGGVMIHTEPPVFHPTFRPWRLIALAFKAIRRLWPDEPLWRHFPYEFERERLAIDLINGGPRLRTWVDDPEATPGDLEQLAMQDERAWGEIAAGVRFFS